MPLYNEVYKATVTNGGGTVNLPCTDSTVNRYVFSGTATLAAGYVIQASGTPVEGMEFDIRWQAVVTTAGANVVTVFGTVLSTSQALTDLQINCYYNGSAWDVDIIEDNIDNIWEFGSGGVTSAKLVNAAGTTATVAGAVSIGTACTSSGSTSFTAGYNNDATAQYAAAINSNNTADNTSAFACNEGNTASGESSLACGDSNLAFGQASFAEGFEVQALGDFSHAGGVQSVPERYGQWSRATGRDSSQASTDYMQCSKLTLWKKTTNATPAVLLLDGLSAGQVLTIGDTGSVFFRGELVALQIGGSAGTVGDTATFHFNGNIKNVSGTTALVDTVRWQDNTGAWGGSASRTQDAAASTWTAVPTANNVADSLDITVTGEANKTILWLLNIELTEIKIS